MFKHAKEVSCPLCGKRFASESDVYDHLTSTNEQCGENAEQACEFCGETMHPDCMQSHLHGCAAALAAGWTPEEDLLGVRCPFPGCGKTVDVFLFTWHARTEHRDAKCREACPVCPFMGVEAPPIADDYDLLEHLLDCHPDEDVTCSAIAPKEDFTVVVNKDSTQECHLCYVEFEPDDELVLTKCACMYHKDCFFMFRDSQRERHCDFFCPQHTHIIFKHGNT